MWGRRLASRDCASPKPSYGPLNPPLRAVDCTGVGGWSRWDVAGHRTIYAAVPEQFAYQEALQYITPADTLQATRMADVFDDQEDSDQSVLEAIAEEFGDMFRWEPTAVAQQWRTERCLYEVTLPTDGWFIEIMHGDSVQALNAALGPLTGMPGMVDPTERITLAHLFGADRALTCRIATALHGLVLDDGSQPHGISFNSKLGIEGQCWAVWLRALDRARPVGLLALVTPWNTGPVPKSPDTQRISQEPIIDIMSSRSGATATVRPRQLAGLLRLSDAPPRCRDSMLGSWAR